MPELLRMISIIKKVPFGRDLITKKNKKGFEMNQNKNNKIPLIMETPPMRISLCIEDHPVDKTDPVYKLNKAVGDMEVTLNGIFKKVGVK